MFRFALLEWWYAAHQKLASSTSSNVNCESLCWKLIMHGNIYMFPICTSRLNAASYVSLTTEWQWVCMMCVRDARVSLLKQFSALKCVTWSETVLPIHQNRHIQIGDCSSVITGWAAPKVLPIVERDFSACASYLQDKFVFSSGFEQNNVFDNNYCLIWFRSAFNKHVHI